MSSWSNAIHAIYVLEVATVMCRDPLKFRFGDARLCPASSRWRDKRCPDHSAHREPSRFSCRRPPTPTAAQHSQSPLPRYLGKGMVKRGNRDAGNPANGLLTSRCSDGHLPQLKNRQFLRHAAQSRFFFIARATLRRPLLAPSPYDHPRLHCPPNPFRLIHLNESEPLRGEGATFPRVE